MAFEQFFPFSPAYSTWEEWNGNLIIWYGQETIPQNSEVNWKDTANNVAQLPTFQAYPVPSPETFANWQDWANEFTQIVNGPSR
jgi:hypothetical protein